MRLFLIFMLMNLHHFNFRVNPLSLRPMVYFYFVENKGFILRNCLSCNIFNLFLFVMNRPVFNSVLFSSPQYILYSSIYIYACIYIYYFNT